MKIADVPPAVPPVAAGVVTVGVLLALGLAFHRLDEPQRGPICKFSPQAPGPPLPAIPDFPPDRVVVTEPDWTERFDFDGDGLRDRVVVSFSGGAHCCYTVAVETSRGRRVAIPFELDGGYVGGLDLSRPDHFGVVVDAGGVASFAMEIATYNGEALPIPRAWKRRWGIASHRIRVHLRDGRLRVRSLR